MQKKNKWTVIAFIGLALVIISAVTLAITKIQKANIVVAMGIGGFRTVFTIGCVLLVLGMAIACTCIVKYTIQCTKERKAIQQYEKETLKKSVENAHEHIVTDTRNAVQQATAQYPKINMNALIRQMNRMDDMQRRLETLLSQNELSAFQYTVDILNEAEEEICKDIKAFLNYILVLDDEDRVQEKYDKLLCSNENRLDKVQELLVTLADFVSTNMSSGDADIKIQACNEAIRETFTVGTFNF